MRMGNGLGVFGVEHEGHLSHVRHARGVLRRYSLIEAFFDISSGIDLGDFKWEVVGRYVGAYIGTKIC